MLHSVRNVTSAAIIAIMLVLCLYIMYSPNEWMCNIGRQFKSQSQAKCHQHYDISIRHMTSLFVNISLIRWSMSPWLCPSDGPLSFCAAVSIQEPGKTTTVTEMNWFNYKIIFFYALHMPCSIFVCDAAGVHCAVHPMGAAIQWGSCKNISNFSSLTPS